MNDCPTHPSILTWKLLTSTHGLGPLKSNLSTGTTLTMPGLSATVIAPPIGTETTGKSAVGKAQRPARTKRSCNAGGTRQRHTGRSAHVDTAADLVTRHEGPLRLARTLKGTVEGAPPTRYSRVDTAVVSGAT